MKNDNLVEDIVLLTRQGTLMMEGIESHQHATFCQIIQGKKSEHATLCQIIQGKKSEHATICQIIQGKKYGLGLQYQTSHRVDPG